MLSVDLYKELWKNQLCSYHNFRNLQNSNQLIPFLEDHPDYLESYLQTSLNIVNSTHYTHYNAQHLASSSSHLPYPVIASNLNVTSEAVSSLHLHLQNTPLWTQTHENLRLEINASINNFNRDLQFDPRYPFYHSPSRFLFTYMGIVTTLALTSCIAISAVASLFNS